MRAFAGCHLGALCLVLILTACGGGGGGDNNNSSSNQSGNSGLAPSSLSGDVLTLTVTGENDRQIAFTDASNWQEIRGTTTVTGTYTYQANQDGRSAAVTLSEPGGSQALGLTFSSSNNGLFNYTAGREGQGTFTLAQSQNSQPPPDQNPPPIQGNAPASLAGKTMLATRTFTSTGPVGQTHTYTFTNTSFHDSDPPEESAGRYDYHPDQGSASLDLDYTTPASFSKDTQQLEMRFDTPTTGIFTSTYTRGDGTVIQINGTFEFQQ